MPPNFQKILGEENFLAPVNAQRWIIEYKKYLCLQYFTTARVIPSEAVDIVWHLHQSFMPHYRRMCMKFWGRVWPHQCAMVFGMTDLSQQNYENTLKYYYEFYMGTAPPDIWE